MVRLEVLSVRSTLTVLVDLKTPFEVRLIASHFFGVLQRLILTQRALNQTKWKEYFSGGRKYYYNVRSFLSFENNSNRASD
jgi:hypothetical protein